MHSTPFMANLAQIETRLDDVAKSLTRAPSVDLPEVCGALQTAALDFAATVKQMPTGFKPDALTLSRLRKVSAGLASCRESLIRHSVLTQHALGAIVPAACKDTYSGSLGGYPRQKYGSAGIQSGEFQAVLA